MHMRNKLSTKSPTLTPQDNSYHLTVTQEELRNFSTNIKIEDREGRLKAILVVMKNKLQDFEAEISRTKSYAKRSS